MSQNNVNNTWLFRFLHFPLLFHGHIKNHGILHEKIKRKVIYLLSYVASSRKKQCIMALCIITEPKNQCAVFIETQIHIPYHTQYN